MTDSPHVSKHLIRESALEYRAKRPRTKTIHEDPFVRDVFAAGGTMGLIVELLFEIHRSTIAAEIAIGLADEDLTHQCLKALVVDVRLVAKTWNRHRDGVEVSE